MKIVWPDLNAIIPEGMIGNHQIEHFEITPETHQRLRDGLIPPGKYVRLLRSNWAKDGQPMWNDAECLMSNTLMEEETNKAFVLAASGDVLIAGLGIGFALIPVLLKPEVTSVTVVEISNDVRMLVEPYLRVALGRRAEILTAVTGDIHEWSPPRGSRYDTIWIDIWGEVNEEELAKDAAALRRRFYSRKNKNGWISSWKLP